MRTAYGARQEADRQSGWATKASLEYMNDAGPCGNEWANQALFDYKGNALKTLQVIRDF